MQTGLCSAGSHLGQAQGTLALLQPTTQYGPMCFCACWWPCEMLQMASAVMAAHVGQLPGELCLSQPIIYNVAIAAPSIGGHLRFCMWALKQSQCRQHSGRNAAMPPDTVTPHRLVCILAEISFCNQLQTCSLVRTVHCSLFGFC